jgi:hypothetical protein
MVVDRSFDTDSGQTDCGRTIRNVNGDKDARVVIEGVVNVEQARQLDDLRVQPNGVRVRDVLYGEREVDFDTISFEQTDEESVGDVSGVTGPIFRFQVQSKQENQGEDQGPLGGSFGDLGP